MPAPYNEPVLAYAPDAPERRRLQARIAAMQNDRIEIRHRIGGAWVAGAEATTLFAPHDLGLALADVHRATRQNIEAAISSALAAAHDWSRLPFAQRAAIFLRAAELLTTTWRETTNAATILGQSKSYFQSEIDAVCELADFWRFNVAYAETIMAEQPLSPHGFWNTMDYRPLDGFVLAITPFNFTSIAGNLPTAPALMGNVVVWKPSPKQALSAHYLMELLIAAGLPDGVINLIYEDGPLTTEIAMSHRAFAGLHFTGSTHVFNDLWARAAANLSNANRYPRLVGETSGKNFVLAHPSAERDPLAVALARGAFEYQGQKCSAASRAYIPRSLWPELREQTVEIARSLTVGDVADPSTFMGAVIAKDARDRHARAIDEAVANGAELLTGGKSANERGWFIDPTILLSADPRSSTMTTELFGPILTVFVYDDADYESLFPLIDESSPFALTGAVFATDRNAVLAALDGLRSAAGNFYINDKPTGAVVGQQPFGGGRASGTNDKAGSPLNLLRWTSPRAIKETFVPPADWRYPHLSRPDDEAERTRINGSAASPRV